MCIPYGLYSGTSLGGTTWGTLEGYPGRVLSAYVLDDPLPESSALNGSDEDQKAYQKYPDNNMIAPCIMLTSMSSELQKQHEAMTAYDIVVHLELFHEQARCERFEVSELFFFFFFLLKDVTPQNRGVR